MKDFKITALDLDSDLAQISDWETIYKNHPGYKAIIHFILEDITNYSLADVIRINHEQFPIGDDERKLAFALKSKDEELLGFILALVSDKTTPSPCLFFQFVVINPEHQGKGYGKRAIKELTENSEQYFGVPITEFYGYVHEKNYHSMKLFLGFGASLKKMENSCYYKAEKKMPKIELDKE